MSPSKRFMELLTEMEEIHIKKNAGYAGDSLDSFANFRNSELFGVSPFLGCLVRMSDKFMRVASLTKNSNNEQVGESIKDSLIDLANYAIIGICLYEEQEKKEEDEINERVVCSETPTFKNSK